MCFIIDRIEGEFAVCENKKREMINIPLHELPENCKEGMTFQLIDGVYCLDTKTGNERHANIKKTMDRLWKNP